MKVSAIGFVFLACIPVTCCLAAPGDTIWTRTYGGIYEDVARSIQQTTDGGYIIAGDAFFFPEKMTDFYVIKLDADGDTLWTRLYGGDEPEHGAYSVCQTSDGGYVIAGGTYSFGAGGLDCYLVRTDANGDTLGTRTYGGVSYDKAESVKQNADGGYIIAGKTRSYGAGEADFYVIRTDAYGDTIWTRTFGGAPDDMAHAVQLTADGGYIIAGQTHSFGTGGYDYYLVKTDADGDTMWTRIFGGRRDDIATSVQQTDDGGYIVAGYSLSFRAGNNEIYVVKTDENGDMLWTRTYGGSDNDGAYSILQTGDGAYVVAGFTRSFGAGESDMYVIKIEGGTVSIDDDETAIPSTATLIDNYPNPFNWATTINYRLPFDCEVKLVIYNLLGQTVETPVDGPIEAGCHIVQWNASSYASGIYFYKLTAGGKVLTKRMMLLK